MKVLCIGNASYDVVIPVDGFPKENFKYRVDNAFSFGGGSGATAAYLLGKWGIDTYFQGCVGNDDYGNDIINEFNSVNVNTDYVERTDSTPLSFVLVNNENGSRTLFDMVKSENKLSNASYGFVPDIILVDGHHYEISKNVFMMYPNAIKVIDAGRVSNDILDLCTKVDYLICSKGFAERVTKTRIDFNNLKTLKDVYTSLEKKYYGHIIITLEEHGCIYRDDKELKIVTGLNVKAVDTTGAGDIFHGAFVYCLANHYSITKCVKISNIAAGLSVTKLGTRNSIYSIEEVMKKYEEFS